MGSGGRAPLMESTGKSAAGGFGGEADDTFVKI